MCRGGRIGRLQAAVIQDPLIIGWEKILSLQNPGKHDHQTYHIYFYIVYRHGVPVSEIPKFLIKKYRLKLHLTVILIYMNLACQTISKNNKKS